MPKPTGPQVHSLITYFAKAVEADGKKVSMNRNKAKFGFENMLRDYSMDDAKALIDFYVSKYTEPTSDHFLYNYEKVESLMAEAEADEKTRNRLREETKERLRLWKEKWDK